MHADRHLPSDDLIGGIEPKPHAPVGLYLAGDSVHARPFEDSVLRHFGRLEGTGLVFIEKVTCKLFVVGVGAVLNRKL